MGTCGPIGFALEDCARRYEPQVWLVVRKEHGDAHIWMWGRREERRNSAAMVGCMDQVGYSVLGRVGWAVGHLLR